MEEGLKVKVRKSGELIPAIKEVTGVKLKRFFQPLVMSRDKIWKKDKLESPDSEKTFAIYFSGYTRDSLVPEPLISPKLFLFIFMKGRICEWELQDIHQKKRSERGIRNY